MRVGFVTCRTLPEPDYDEAPLLAAASRAGIEPALVPWDDPDSRPEECDLLVLRSCWNYHLDVRAFLDWVDRAARATRLLNPPDIVRWNSHKGYLTDLGSRGCPVVPTVFVLAASPARLGPIVSERGWARFVVKPAVSAGSYMTRVFGAEDLDEAQDFLDRLLADRDAMVQPYLPSVDSVGERSVVWVAGEATHTVVKRPRFAGDVESVATGASPTDEERQLIDRALGPDADRLLYARLDLMLDGSSQWLVSELELIEPSLFFPYAPTALERFVLALG